MYIHYILLLSKVIICSGDVEVNSGFELNSCHNFSICRWNVHSLPFHKFIKVFLLRAYANIKKFDVLFLSDTYLDLFILLDGANLELPGYYLERADHLSKKVVFAST